MFLGLGGRDRCLPRTHELWIVQELPACLVCQSPYLGAAAEPELTLRQAGADTALPNAADSTAARAGQVPGKTCSRCCPWTRGSTRQGLPINPAAAKQKLFPAIARPSSPQNPGGPPFSVALGAWPVCASRTNNPPTPACPSTQLHAFMLSGKRCPQDPAYAQETLFLKMGLQNWEWELGNGATEPLTYRELLRPKKTARLLLGCSSFLWAPSCLCVK